MPIDLINIFSFGLYKKNITFYENIYKERLRIQQEQHKQIEELHLKYYNELLKYK